MHWLSAWWKQLVGPPAVDPWEDNPQIRAERAGQHDRITKAAEGSYYEQQRLRERRVEAVEESWRRRDVQH